MKRYNFIFPILICILGIFFADGFADQKGKNADAGKKNRTIAGVEFIYIPAASFDMGLNIPRDEDYYLGENIKHRVKLSPYWISRYEITQAQYQAMMRKNPSPVKGDTLPVENISWQDAQAFCAAFSSRNNVTARLPYEAEWEYAARGGTHTIYYWGDEISGDYCWYVNNSSERAQPVGLKKPNSFGLYDMCGNVCEWVYDWYDQNYYKNSPIDNPKGPSSGGKKILRGGSYKNSPGHPSPMRVDIKIVDQPDARSEGWGAFGIRLVIE